MSTRKTNRHIEKAHTRKRISSSGEYIEAINFFLDNIYVRFGNKVYRRVMSCTKSEKWLL